MNEQTSTTIMTPIIQYGFAGFCVIQFGIIVWFVRAFINVLKENNNVIATNTQAIQGVDKNAKDAKDVAIELKDELYKRPCIARIKVNPNL